MVSTEVQNYYKVTTEVSNQMKKEMQRQSFKAQGPFPWVPAQQGSLHWGLL